MQVSVDYTFEDIVAILRERVTRQLAPHFPVFSIVKVMAVDGTTSGHPEIHTELGDEVIFRVILDVPDVLISDRPPPKPYLAGRT